MNPKNSESSNIEDLVKNAKLVGFDEVPESTSALEADIAAVFRETGKKFTAQAIHGLLKAKYPEKSAKYYSDKLWYMEKKGTLEHCGVRGWYKFKGGA